MPAAAHGLRGTRPGTIAAMDCTSLGTTAIGITTIAHGTTAGTTPGTTDGMTHTTARGDGHTTDTTAGTRLTGTADTTTIITTQYMAVVADIILPTEVQVMLVLST